jgi:hypothetical protein
MRNVLRLSGIAATAGFLAACQAIPAAAPPPLVQVQPPVQQNPVDGDWLDENGVVSSFRAGSFESRTTDTNQVLARGNYQRTSDRSVQINSQSILRGTNIVANCALATPAQMNCTTDQNLQFSLYRRAAG